MLSNIIIIKPEKQQQTMRVNCKLSFGLFDTKFSCLNFITFSGPSKQKESVSKMSYVIIQSHISTTNEAIGNKDNTDQFNTNSTYLKIIKYKKKFIKDDSQNKLTAKKFFLKKRKKKRFPPCKAEQSLRGMELKE